MDNKNTNDADTDHKIMMESTSTANIESASSSAEAHPSEPVATSNGIVTKSNDDTHNTIRSGDENDDDEVLQEEDDEEQNDTVPTSRASCYKKTAVGLVLLGLIIFVIADSLTNQHIKTGLLAFLEWIEDHLVVGVLSFVLVYFLATVFFIPGSILTLGAGFVFSSAMDSLWIGVLLGTAAVFVGASLGAIVAFLLGRYLFREAVAVKLTQKYKIFEAIDRALEQNGLKIMVLLRLSPIFPFNALNYSMGITAIRFWDYVLACLGMLPGTIVYVFLGASAGSLAELGGDEDETEEDDDNKTVTIVVIVVGVVFGFLAVGLTSYYAKQELNKVLEEEAEQNDESNNGVDENAEEEISV
ncbi:unnamed protein product [Pseudo-nitzschia multistriata]|uniref:VTT domain-containing protein n=1 Tax=Pseudo-nitzschia multistriata TaxID=183589 RepID=A0A448ZNF0_9STRA|nr:unnamed protein product [Pseudo-nitzschia multistriata]